MVVRLCCFWPMLCVSSYVVLLTNWSTITPNGTSMRTLRFLIICIIASVNVLAGSEGRLGGIVTDSATSTPLEGIRVVVKGTNKATYTDDKGDFSLKGLPYGVDARCCSVARDGLRKHVW